VKTLIKLLINAFISFPLLRPIFIIAYYLFQVTELLIELQDFNLEKSYALYSAFAIGTEVEAYSISFLGSYEGDAGTQHKLITHS
jgi:hypothetical protein